MGVAERDWFRDRSDEPRSSSRGGSTGQGVNDSARKGELFWWTALIVCSATLMVTSIGQASPLWSNLLTWKWPLDFSLRVADPWTSVSLCNGGCAAFLAALLLVALRTRTPLQLAALTWYSGLPTFVVVLLFVPHPMWEERSWESLGPNLLDPLGFLVGCFATCLCGGVLSLAVRELRKCL